jgi:hypothetical protein
MKAQRGVSLGGLLVGAVIFALVALLAMKVVPAWIEYGKIVKVVKAISADGGLKDAPVSQIRESFEKRADIDEIKSIQAEDLEISKEEGVLKISFAYTAKIPLFGNASLVFDFAGGNIKE